tara:strand:+ start:39 stop:431 length:393 start_codon:yes stop_codon:yes gene_type:complete
MIKTIDGWIQEDVPTELTLISKRDKWQGLTMKEVKDRAEYCARCVLKQTGAERIRYSVFSAPTSQFNEISVSRVFFVIDQLGNYRSAKSLKDGNTEVIFTQQSQGKNTERYSGFMGLYDDMSAGRTRVKC